MTRPMNYFGPTKIARAASTRHRADNADRPGAPQARPARRCKRPQASFAQFALSTRLASKGRLTGTDVIIGRRTVLTAANPGEAR